MSQMAGLGIIESLMNTGMQGLGGFASAGTQAIGAAILGHQVPKTYQQQKDVANWAGTRNTDIVRGAMTNMQGRNTDAANWNRSDANGDAVSDQGRRFREFAQQSRQDTQRLDADQARVAGQAAAGMADAQRIAQSLTGLAERQISDVFAASDAAQIAFAGDREATLTALKDDVAANMNSFRGANDNLIAVGIQKSMEALQANGMADDPLAKLQAETQVKGSYTENLGRQMTQLMSNFTNRLSETHLALVGERTKLFDTIAGRKNEAFATAGGNVEKAGQTLSRARELEVGALERMSAFRAEHGRQSNRDVMDAYSAMSDDARAAAQVGNQTDMWGAQLEATATANTASNLLGAEALALNGWSQLAGRVGDFTWSVPQMNVTDSLLAFQMANSGGGDSGGNFGASIGVPGIASVNAST